MKRIYIRDFIRKSAAVIMGFALMAGLAACGAVGSAGTAVNETVGDDSSEKLKIVTTIFPEYDWVREIVGLGANSVDKSAVSGVDVSLLLDNGVDLHSYQPSAADIAKISTCDIFIYIGGESDKWVDDALKEAVNKDIKVIDLMDVLGEAVKEEELVEGMQGEEEEEHEHEESEEAHDHEDGEDHDEEEGHHHEEGEIEYDEHIWLSLKNAQVLCSEIESAIAEKDVANEAVYKANLDAFNAKLAELDSQYQQAADNAKVNTILFGDRFPFRYMVDDYNIAYYAAFVGCSAETEASFETIIFLSGKVDELGLPTICTIENSDQKIAETIKKNTKSEDIEIITMNSLQSITAKDIEEGTSYLSSMQDNLESLKKALGE